MASSTESVRRTHQSRITALSLFHERGDEAAPTPEFIEA
jgi:hypothetical protein